MLFGGDHGCERLKTTFRWNTIYFRICNLSNYNEPFLPLLLFPKWLPILQNSQNHWYPPQTEFFQLNSRWQKRKQNTERFWLCTTSNLRLKSVGSLLMLLSLVRSESKSLHLSGTTVFCVETLTALSKLNKFQANYIIALAFLHQLEREQWSILQLHCQLACLQE
jgi:hypothetical protein